ncbi:MAG: hypothetical protein P1V20_01545 [Verrucomicrobiales bacterium]|nr:hypothetical protein [Verrucomicrobiales bacterium]
MSTLPKPVFSSISKLYPVGSRIVQGTITVLAVTLIHSLAVHAGPMSADSRGVIHELFASHEGFTRNVETTADGYRATTVSKDPEKAALLRKHVEQMGQRLHQGMSVRRWDPAFAELREHYDDMTVEIEKIDGGIAAIVTGKTPEAILVAQNHARIISGFIANGSAQMHVRHATAKKAETKTGTADKEACADCNQCNEDAESCPAKSGE